MSDPDLYRPPKHDPGVTVPCSILRQLVVQGELHLAQMDFSPLKEAELAELFLMEVLDEAWLALARTAPRQAWFGLEWLRAMGITGPLQGIPERVAAIYESLAGHGLDPWEQGGLYA